MKKRIHKTREVFKIKNHLYRISPSISDIDVKIIPLNNGDYRSQVSVNIPNRKKIVSTKTDSTLSASLDKAYKAVVKQVNRAIKPSIKRDTIRKHVFDTAA